MIMSFDELADMMMNPFICSRIIIFAYMDAVDASDTEIARENGGRIGRGAGY